ncbi:MAG: DUF1549 domain-containing protein [Verrucomicrobia bacterium]|nr:DUF1549 domain-containing protein [Verrucomicrobiota bacterium]
MIAFPRFALQLGWLLLGIAPAFATVDFHHQIVPILRQHCGECHTGDHRKGGFSMNDRAALLQGSENGPVIDPDRPETSLLLELIGSTDPDVRMPPKGPGLSPDEIGLIRQWLAGGLPWEAGFAFKKAAYEPPLKPRDVTLPPAAGGREHPVDRLVDAYLAAQKLPRPGPADDGTFLRRAHLDLIGLLPTPEEVAAFEKDSATDKRLRLVRDLLARDVDYAEHWLTFWNDLLRNDYGGTGFITGGRKQISQWLYESLTENKPFDQFTRELLAPPTEASRGFIEGIKWRGEVSAGQTVEIQFAQSIGQSFLGINLKCASCHDSFIDRWKLDESYGLAAIYSDRPLEIHRCDKPVGRTARASWLFPELGQVNPAAPRAERLSQLAALMTHPQNGRFSRTLVNRLWHRLMGHGIVHPLDAMQTEPWSADLLDYLARDFQQNGYDIKKSLERIATSEIYQARSIPTDGGKDDATFRGPKPHRLTAEQFVDSVWQLTGAAPTGIQAPVFRGKADPAVAKSIRMLGQWIWGDSAAAGKLPAPGETIVLRTTWTLDAAPALATAIATCDNGFTLYVNNKRVVEGDNWERVTPIALQDRLKAGENQIVALVQNGGDRPNPAGFYFQVLARMADGREAVLQSDATWQFSPSAPKGREGNLGALGKDFKAVTVVTPLPVWTEAVNRQGPPHLARGASPASRMVRASLLKSDFLMRSLGRPNRDQIVSMRPDELTTLEALDLSNGEILTRTLEQGARNLTRRTWGSNAECIRWVYAHALARAPQEAELDAAAELLGETLAPEPLADFLWAVLMQPEFQYVR